MLLRSSGLFKAVVLEEEMDIEHTFERLTTLDEECLRLILDHGRRIMPNNCN